MVEALLAPLSAPLKIAEFHNYSRQLNTLKDVTARYQNKRNNSDTIVH